MREVQNQKLETFITRILALKEQGKSLDEILNLFPEDKETVEEIFKIFNLLKEEKEILKPEPELLSRLLKKLPPEVTEYPKPRYLYEEKKSKGRSFIWSLNELIEETIMSKKVYVTLAAVLVLAILVGGYFFWSAREKTILPMPDKITEEETSLNQDFTDLEGMTKDDSFNKLDEDLNSISDVDTATKEGETIETGKAVEIASLEGLDDELVSELDGFNTDLGDLNDFQQDNSLDSFDSDMSAVGE